MRWLVILARLTVPAMARAPDSADADLAPWFESLRNPTTNMSCCEHWDGHILKDSEWRAVKDGYEILSNGAWIPVPPEAVLQHTANPVGAAVAFFPPDGAPPIYCFVLPSQT